MNALGVVDAAALGRVLLVGPVPPQGRDYDVLAPKESYDSICEALRRNGFEVRRTTWARFDPFELVDLRLLADSSALSRAVPFEKWRNVCRPGPEDVAIKPPTPRIRSRLRRVRESGVVTLSGVDGAGKSTQAELLRDNLKAAGFVTVVEWNRLGHDAWLDSFAGFVRRLLRRRSGSSSGPSGPAPGSGGRHGGPWVVVVGLANALAHQRSVRQHTLAGRIVVCDRYVLDSVVDLLTRYPPGTGRRIAIALVRWLSPRPRAAFLLDLPGEVAYERRPRRRDEVIAQAKTYADEAARLGVVSLDATRPAADLAADIARQAWRRI